jgi:hypothetical protein
MYLIDRKVVFLHLPKTGGTWLAETLGRAGCLLRTPANGSGHQGPRSIPAEWPDVPRFGFVREPLAWYRSWFQFCMRGHENGWRDSYGSEIDGFCRAIATIGDNLPTFIEREVGMLLNRDLLLAPPPSGVGYLTWLAEHTLGPSVEVLRYENLRAELERIAVLHDLGPAPWEKAELIRLCRESPPANVSSGDQVMSAETVDLILGREAGYIQRYYQ